MVTVTLPDGSKHEVKPGTTPGLIAESIGPKLAKDALAAKVNGKLVDLSFPIEEDCELSILTFNTPGGKDVFSHSSAHILAFAVEQLFPGVKKTIGPSVEEGFYYDFADLQITPEHFSKIEEKMKEIVKQDLRFERKEVSAEEARQLFKSNRFKLEMVEELVEQDDPISVYYCGDFVDLCSGPHIPSTGRVEAFKLTKISGAYWRGKAENEQLTRIYGVSFPSKKDLKEYLQLLEEAQKRDHRKIGQELKLFMFHEFSPGSPFFYPKGALVYNELMRFIREQYRLRGFEEVITPQLFNKALWEMSGHWEHYKEDMFLLQIDDQPFSLKPMNCPSHVLMFKSLPKSYRDLPWRCADFGVLHRNELRGVLAGLTRCRKFSQDDAHIFCTPDQIESEIKGALDFIKYVYKDVFKFSFSANLSTKPEKAMGADELWENAEQGLKNALDSVNMKYNIKEGEGAFYGPKIDIDVKDALGRMWQTATIQLDFQMPLRMGAEYEGKDNRKHTAVMIHRAVLGSMERFMAILLEHTAGRLPLWLSPEQARVLALSDKYNEYAAKVRQQLFDAGLRVTTDLSNQTLSKKVREAQLDQVNYILVVGEREQDSGTVNIRTRDNKVLGEKLVAEFANDCQEEIEKKA